jgi:hypothetical protein
MAQSLCMDGCGVWKMAQESLQERGRRVASLSCACRYGAGCMHVRSFDFYAGAKRNFQ